MWGTTRRDNSMMRWHPLHSKWPSASGFGTPKRVAPPGPGKRTTRPTVARRFSTRSRVTRSTGLPLPSPIADPGAQGARPRPAQGAFAAHASGYVCASDRRISQRDRQPANQSVGVVCLRRRGGPSDCAGVRDDDGGGDRRHRAARGGDSNRHHHHHQLYAPVDGAFTAVVSAYLPPLPPPCR